MTKKTVVYIAGKMRSLYQFGFPLFDRAKADLIAQGYDVISPADLDRENGFDPVNLSPDYDWNSIPEGFSFDDCVTRDIEAVRKCDAIYMLKGWEDSKGARAEKALAEWLGKDVMYEDVYAVTPSGEVRTKDPITGAEKGSKKARFDLIPVKPLWELAEHYGIGSLKYADRNWEKGYKWSLSFAACMRHLQSFWNGEDIDKETGSKHIIASAWHCLAMAEFMETNRQNDDRVKKGG